MTQFGRRSALLMSVCVASVALAGCGGGGGGARPAPVSEAPPPTSTASSADDAEYRRSNGAVAAGALSAYNAGATGQGVKIAVVDSGINQNLPDFAGRVDPASRDLVANRGISDSEGHGTSVTAVAAAGRDGGQIQGVAYRTTILSFNTADPNNCVKDDGCKHSDRAIAQGIDLARENGARVINISLGGEGAGSSVLQALTRATQAGVVVVVSAGNGGREPSGANPDGFSLALAGAGGGLVIIAGAHDANRQIADFSNRAGTGQQSYLTALGDRVRSFDQNGVAYLYSGTSYSAPVISGAAALLASAFPNLSGNQIVQILMNSADDAGAAGTDATFGRGILNIARAFAPQGATSLAGSGTPVSPSSSAGTTSGPMGDAKGSMSGAIILDGFSRAYAMNFAQTLTRVAPEQPLAQALSGDFRTGSAVAGKTAVTVTVNRNLIGRPLVGLAQTGMSFEDARTARATAGMALSRLGPKTAVAFGLSESGRTLQQRLSGEEGKAFLVARDPLTRNGFHADAGTSMGVRHDLGPVALTLTNERGRVYQPGLNRALAEPGYGISSVTADRTIGRARLSLGATRLDEQGTMLGSRFGAAFATGGATSTFLDTGLSYDLGRGWGVDASYRRGWTRMAGTGALVEQGRLTSEAWSFDLAKADAFRRGDSLAFRVMQPLRVSSGGFDLNVPVSYSYATGAVGYERQLLSLAPTGRELDFELGYSVGLLGGRLGLNTFLRTDPGHIQAAEDDVGAAVRFTLGF